MDGTDQHDEEVAQWLQTIQGKVQVAMESKEEGLYDSELWTDFISKVVLLFKHHDKREKMIVSSVIGLFKYYISELHELQSVSQVQSDFRTALEGKGVPGVMADFLFINVAYPPDQVDTVGPLPHTPNEKSRGQSTVPPSTGKSYIEQQNMRHSPSSDEGKEEGLRIASEDGNTHMQCTSVPACVELLEILEDTISNQRNIAPKFHQAAEHVRDACGLLNLRSSNLNLNERFFTGAMTNAMNSVLEDGYYVLHQACIGTGATHSDLSGSRISTELNAWPNILMVGEGKWNSNSLRNETRGQIFNELSRHRTIDTAQGSAQNYGPILILAFDKNHLEIDLAFPTKKASKLEWDGVVSFPQETPDDTESFWTVRLLRVSLDGSVLKTLPIVLSFISEALKKLHSWLEKPRMQYKIPMPLNDAAVVDMIEYNRENVTILKLEGGTKFVYKEYCYHLCQVHSFFAPLHIINEEDQRRPPPEELRHALGEPYATEWKVHNGPFQMSVLQYPFINGSSDAPTVPGWLMVLGQVKKMHLAGYVHGDLLPRNIIFGGEGSQGFLIDFDLSRREDSTYVKGYNHNDFVDFRHKDARSGKKMKKEHDLHSLRQLSDFFFDLNGLDISTKDLDGLCKEFCDSVAAKSSIEVKDESSGSPTRTIR